MQTSCAAGAHQAVEARARSPLPDAAAISGYGAVERRYLGRTETGEVHTSTLIDHLERYLGPIHSGAPLGAGVQGVLFPDRPFRGSTTFTTLGLSNHLLSQERGPQVRLEFVLACRNAVVDAFSPLSVLADISEHAVAAHSAPARGTVIGPRGRFFPESTMEALYCAEPVYFDDGLTKFSGFPQPFLLVWLVPIAPVEAAFVRSHGWSRFEDVLAETQPDLLDLLRLPAVDHS